MLGTAHREEDENGTVEIADSYNNILKLFLRGRIWVHLAKYVFVYDFLKCFKMFWPELWFSRFRLFDVKHWYRPLAFGFSWENTNRNNCACSLWLRVLGFTLPGFQILARRSLFRADKFFLESKCINSIVQKTGIIHLLEFKHPTSASQTDKESYFVLLNVEAVQFSVAKNLAVNHFPLNAPPAVETWTANCWNATQNRSLLTFSGLLFAVFHEKPYGAKEGS